MRECVLSLKLLVAHIIFLKQTFNILLAHFEGDQLGGMDRYYVLRSRCAFVLELDLLCTADCGKATKRLLLLDGV